MNLLKFLKKCFLIKCLLLIISFNCNSQKLTFEFDIGYSASNFFDGRGIRFSEPLSFFYYLEEYSVLPAFSVGLRLNNLELAYTNNNHVEIIKDLFLLEFPKEGDLLSKSYNGKSITFRKYFDLIEDKLWLGIGAGMSFNGRGDYHTSYIGQVSSTEIRGFVDEFKRRMWATTMIFDFKVFDFHKLKFKALYDFQTSPFDNILTFQFCYGVSF